MEYRSIPSGIFPNEIQPMQFPVKNRETEAARRANSCQGGRISHLEMGRTDRGIMKLLTSKQAAESWADGGGRWRGQHQIELRGKGLTRVVEDPVGKKGYKKEKLTTEVVRVLH